MNTRKKRNKTNFFMMGCISLLLTFSTGCSKDDPISPLGNCFEVNWAQQYTNELQVWSNTIAAYNENPTQANCDKYKTAAKNYLDALRSIADCVPTENKAEIDQSINEAKAEIDREGCD